MTVKPRQARRLGCPYLPPPKRGAGFFPGLKAGASSGGLGER